MLAMEFSGKQEIMRAHRRWMQVLIGICQIPVFCCLDSPAVLGIWHRWRCGMLPITISWKENKLKSQSDGFSSDFIWAGNPLCCLLRFLISLSLWYFDCQFQRMKHQIKFQAKNCTFKKQWFKLVWYNNICWELCGSEIIIWNLEILYYNKW